MQSRFMFLLFGLLFSNYCSSSTDTDPYAPLVSAKGYLIMDYNSGQIIANVNGDQRLEPASITKVMSAYVVFAALKKGTVKLTDLVTISAKSSAKRGSRTFLKAGSKVQLETLVKGMIVQSGNDAAIALAEHIAGDEDIFVGLMNREANNLKMRSSNFVNVTGLPTSNHYTSARDMAKLARAMIRDFPEYYKYYSIKQFTHAGVAQQNRNTLLFTDSRVDGLKTGYTKSAGYCLLASARKGARRLITVVLRDNGGKDRAESSKTLMDYGFKGFAVKRVVKKLRPLTQIRVYGGHKRLVSAGILKDSFLTLRKKFTGKIRFSYNYLPKLSAPIKKNHTKVGTLTISLDNNVVSEHTLIALEDINKGGWLHRTADKLLLLNK